jgi:ribosomal protein S12 methylthiotransferase
MVEPRRRVHVLTLGCPKNQVDSEVMLGVLTRAGHEVVLDPDAADVLVVNTCAFIGPAKEESIDAVLDAARRGDARGAPAGRHRLSAALRGRSRARAAGGRRIRRHGRPHPHRRRGRGSAGGCPRRLSRGAARAAAARCLSPRQDGCLVDGVPEGSEGCDHRCSFCIIPTIRGRHESRPLTDVLSEAASLVGDGAIELNLIAQDLTAYGRDSGRRRHPGPPAARTRHAGPARAGSACCTPIRRRSPTTCWR